MVAISEVPYYPFDPHTAETIDIEGVACFKYLSESVYLQTVARLASEIDPRDAVILYNLQGAKMMALDLWNMWAKSGMDISHSILAPIEYKSSDSNQTSGHVLRIKPITSDLVGGKRTIILEDIGDSNGVMTVMTQDALEKGVTSVETATLVLKMNRPLQLPFEYSHIGVRIDDKWVGGWGMDFGTPDVEPDFPRSSKILVVKK